jgi:hypothetical protein
MNEGGRGGSSGRGTRDPATGRAAVGATQAVWRVCDDRHRAVGPSAGPVVGERQDAAERLEEASLPLHQAVGGADGQEPHQEAVHHGEDAGRGADAECQREDGGRAVGGRRAQHAHRVAQVLRERLDERNAASVAARLLDLLLVAERKPGAAPCLVRRHAPFDVRLRLALDVQVDLFVEVRFHVVALESAFPREVCQPGGSSAAMASAPPPADCVSLCVSLFCRSVSQSVVFWRVLEGGRTEGNGPENHHFRPVLIGCGGGI